MTATHRPPARRLAPKLRRERLGFKTWLVAEQLEEASFLYDQRRYLLDRDQLSWCDLGNNEARTLRHLQALTLLTRARDIDIEGLITDSGRLHTAVSLYCREGWFDALAARIANADLSNNAVFDAIADGLKWEAPVSWQRRLLALPSLADSVGTTLLAEVFGYRRWPLDALLDKAPPVSDKLIWAIGRSGGRKGLALLDRIVRRNGHPGQTSASVALLRWQASGHLRGLSPLVDAGHFAVLPLSLCGATDIQARLERLAATRPTADIALAMGLLGKPSAVEPLIGCLSSKALAAAASTALELITGAGLIETVFIPDDIDEAELTDAELRRFRNGEPIFAPDEVPGETVERLSQDPATWTAWWREHRVAFEPDMPHCLGTPYAPTTLVDLLEAPRATLLMRTLAYEALVIRYRVDFAFETDFLVSDQRRILSDFRTWLGAHQEVSKRYAGAVSF